jgi:hypothetical protein
VKLTQGVMLIYSTVLRTPKHGDALKEIAADRKR